MTQVQIQNTSLVMLTRGYLTKNGTITSLELKNEVHRIGINQQFPGAEYNQKMASEFLKEFYENNNSELNRSLTSKDGFTYYCYSLNNSTQSLFDVNAGKIVCYNSQDTTQYVQDNVRRIARTELAKRFGIKDNLVRTCSAKHFLKKYIK